MNFKEIRAMIKGNRTSKKLGNNTYAHIVDAEAVAVRLHQTDVLTFKANGDIKLNSGGWRTVTTKARINEYLPESWYVNQSKGVWYVVQRKDYKNVGRFEDGMVIKGNGTLEGVLPLIPKMAAIDKNLKKQIKTYCLNFVTALESGQVQPSNGDCFFCLMRETKSNRPLGEVVKADHLKEHIKEGYYVFSLLERALESFGASIAMRSYVGMAITGDSKNMYAVDFIQAQVVKALYRYINRQFGYAA